MRLAPQTHNGNSANITAMPTCARYGCRQEAVRKFCSEKCKIAHHNANRDRTNSVKNKCASCGKQFVGRPDRKTCSDKCRQALFQMRRVKVKVKPHHKRLRTGATIILDKPDSE